MKIQTRFSLFAASALAAVSVLTLPLQAASFSTSSKNAKVEQQAAHKSSQPFPFHGDISTVDTHRKTIGIQRKNGEVSVFKITPKSRLEGENKGILKLKDIKAGDKVAGRITKLSANNYEVVSLKVKSAATPNAQGGSKMQRNMQIVQDMNFSSPRGR